MTVLDTWRLRFWNWNDIWRRTSVRIFIVYDIFVERFFISVIISLEFTAFSWFTAFNSSWLHTSDIISSHIFLAAYTLLSRLNNDFFFPGIYMMVLIGSNSSSLMFIRSFDSFLFGFDLNGFIHFSWLVFFFKLISRINRLLFLLNHIWFSWVTICKFLGLGLGLVLNIWFFFSINFVL